MTGRELKDFRLSLKMNQTEFGRMLGFSAPQIRISEIENGHIGVSGRVRHECEKLLASLIKASMASNQ